MAAPTQEQIDALELMIQKAGVIQQMIVGGQTFIFRPIAEMQALLAQMKRALAEGQSETGTTSRLATTSKGLR